MIKYLNGSVQIHRIDGMGFTSYVAYEPYAGHSTLTFEDGVKLGRIGTRPLPTHLEALEPYSDERLARVHDWHCAQYVEAYALIRTAFPEAEGRRWMGEIGS